MELFYLAGVAALAVAGAGGVLVMGQRWGVATRTIEPAGEPYRSAPLRVREWRAAPELVSLAVATNVVWAVATLLLFVPAGALMLLVGEALGVLVLVLVVDGVVLGVTLLRTAIKVMRRSHGAAQAVEHTALWSVFHHVAVALIVMAVFERSLALGALLGVLPGAIGMGLALLLRAAGTQLVRAEAEEAEAA